MRLVAGTADRAPLLAAGVVAGALGLLSLTALTGTKPLATAPVVAAAIVFAVAHRTLLAWPSLLALLVGVVMFIPMQRYVLPGSLPFELEPYRLLVAFMMVGWIASLLADPHVRARASGLDAPLVLLTVATFGSILANRGSVAAFETDVAKSLTFFLSFLLIFYLVVSVVRTRGQVDFVLKVLVGCGAVVAALAIVESRTEFNVFNHLGTALPMLEPVDFSAGVLEERGLRAYASAQHPIALGAALTMLIPPAVYLVRRYRRRHWWLAAGVLLMGSLATLSRTSVIMLLVIGIVFFVLRPAEFRRLLPYLLPALVAVHFVLPGTLGTLKSSFFPEGGLLAEQSANVGSRGQGRIADLGPGLREAAEKPLFGHGLATRRVEFERQNAQILDNQWLATLIELGAVGAFAWGWIFIRSIRRFGRAAKEEAGATGWLFTALTASTASLAVGMVTYDTFAFIQVMLLLFLLLALGHAALQSRRPRTS